jgi:glycosyltransferase involved in cell wall biosynthesis
MLKGNRYKVLGICTDTIKKGDKIFIRNGERVYGAVGWYRIVNPLKKLGAEISVGHLVSSTPQSALELKSKGDIWYCKMADNTDIDAIYGAHKEFTGAKFILDLDDYPGKVNEDHPDFKDIEDRREMRERMIKMADHIVVTNDELKNAIKELNPYITVIPNAIDPKIWEVKRKKRNDGVVRIGWMSSGSHFADLPIINPVIDELIAKYPNVEVHYAGMIWGNKQEGREYHHSGTNGYDDFPQFYADLDIDIAIAPLKDTLFNRCKSNIKWLEAAMLGIPMVASDVLPYRSIQHGKTGFLASNKDQWLKYLSHLIENPAERKKIGSQAKEEVIKNWNIKNFLPLYEKLFVKILEKKDLTVVTAITGGKDDLRPQLEYKGVEYVAFTDLKDSQWKTYPVCDKFKRDVMNAKIHKILTHKYVDTPYIVWIDGNVTLKQDPHNLIKLMGDKDFAFFKHPGRDCLYDEADACVEMGKGNRKELAEQIKAYAKQSVKPHSGLWEVPCFIRKNTPKANAAFERWWVEVTRYSNRDQVSFPVAFKGEKIALIPGSVDKWDDYSDMKTHKKRFPGNEFFKRAKHNHYKNQ